MNILRIHSQPKNPALNQRGFTLFEILIVVSILAGAIAFLVPRTFRTDSGVKKTSRHLLVLSKDIRNQARIKQRTYRLAFKMGGEENSYWVESADGAVPAKTIEQLEEEEKLDEEVRPQNPFKKDDRFTKDAFVLPKGLYIGQVESVSQKNPINEGMAYINYSPTGLVEASAIQLTDKANTNWTLVINSLTGAVTIVPKKLSLKETQLEQ